MCFNYQEVQINPYIPQRNVCNSSVATNPKNISFPLLVINPRRAATFIYFYQRNNCSKV